MVQVRIRLQNHGKKNHPYWWVVIQPKNKHFQGRIIERVGIWAPRKTKTVDRHISLNTYKLKYWLSVGAKPTDGVYRLLYFGGLLPKKPEGFGKDHMYIPKTKPYSLQYFHMHRWGFNQKIYADAYYYEKIRSMKDLIREKIEIDSDALKDIVQPFDLTSKYQNKDIKYDSDMNTDDIDSDDHDFYSRKRNFDIVSKKLNKYFDQKYQLFKGSDLRYNNYLRKLEKLSAKESLDYEGFKDYLDAVKNLNESKNKVLQNIGEHFLNELLSKEAFSKEIKELIRAANVNNLNNKNGQSENTNDKNNPNSDASFKKELFEKLAVQDTKNIIEILSKGFESAAREIFQVNSDETFSGKEFQDIKNLRTAKMLIKIRHGLLIKSKADKDKQNLSVGKIDKDESINDTVKDTFLNSMWNDTKSPKTIKELDLPFFDKDMCQEILSKNSEINNYDDLLFKNINNYLLSTDTFKKFKGLLFHPQLYEEVNMTPESKEQFLLNPNIYLLNNSILDEVINELLNILKKKYDMNEVYRDEETDLNQFEKNDAELRKRRNKMNEKLQELRDKYGEFDILYDDYRGSEELKKELREFKKEYDNEINGLYDIKFKKDLRIVKPPYEVTNKYYTIENVEEEKAREEKFDRIKERVIKEIYDLKNGIEPKKEMEPESLNEEELKYESRIREEYSIKLLGPDFPLQTILPFPENDHQVVDFNPAAKIMARIYRKQPKVPNQDENLLLNKRKVRMSKIFVHSLQETKAITKPRQIEIKKRFVEYFGEYTSLMYPEGFRHYENFETYNALYPTRTIADYQTELHTFCDFDTFVLVTYGLINQIKKIGLMAIEFPEIFDRIEFLSLYTKSKSTEFINHTLKENYKRYLNAFENKNIKFKLIDALEQSALIDLTSTVFYELRELLIDDKTIKLHETITINKFLMRKMPHHHTRGEDLGISRQSPFMPINPLKAHKANPYLNYACKIKKPKVRISTAEYKIRKTNY